MLALPPGLCNGVDWRLMVKNEDEAGNGRKCLEMPGNALKCLEIPELFLYWMIFRNLVYLYFA